MTNVSRKSSVVRADGKAACSRCGRPVQRTRQRGGRGRPQSLCNSCHAEDQRDRRAGTVQVQLTPEEYAAVKAARAAAAAAPGRHRAAAAGPAE